MSARYFCGLCGDEILKRDRHNITIDPDTKIPCHEACLEQRALKLAKSPGPKTLQGCCDDLRRALREHNPGATIASCSCGNAALAFVEDRELGLRYARCLACGANVSLRFIDQVQS